MLKRLVKIGRKPNLILRPPLNLTPSQISFYTTKSASEGENLVKEEKFNYKDKTHYDLLGVMHSASDKELKVAYLRAAKKFHPDVYKGVNKDHFKKINEAYSVLKNP